MAWHRANGDWSMQRKNSAYMLYSSKRGQPIKTNPARGTPLGEEAVQEAESQVVAVEADKEAWPQP